MKAWGEFDEALQAPVIRSVLASVKRCVQFAHENLGEAQLADEDIPGEAKRDFKERAVQRARGNFDKAELWFAALRKLEWEDQAYATQLAKIEVLLRKLEDQYR